MIKTIFKIILPTKETEELIEKLKKEGILSIQEIKDECSSFLRNNLKKVKLQ
tara:strand:- start:1132 stop:1287 length:156 start_codon:yes stop_codon:yes gene_type:complete